MTHSSRSTSGVARTEPAGGALRGYSSAPSSGSSLTCLAGSCQTLLAGATLPEIIKPLLRLAYSRPGCRPHSPALVAVCDVTVVIRHSAAMRRIVNPVIAVSDIYSIEVVASDEVVIDHDIVAAAPADAPSPASPTTAPPDRAHPHPSSQRDRARATHYSARAHRPPTNRS